tara:strand:+ start:275 stop:475 length:201 start_codon:yes stop_codon:yes gene_type:complete
MALAATVLSYTGVVTAPASLPSFRYTTYPVTADAPSSVTGALHANAILDVVCRVLRSAVGAAGDVD